MEKCYFVAIVTILILIIMMCLWKKNAIMSSFKGGSGDKSSNKENLEDTHQKEALEMKK